MSWIQTYTGERFNYETLSPIKMEDVAWSLSHTCRYNGHSHRFYSVAEHCVHVSHAVPAEHALAGLLHDAAEAYVGDLPYPLKVHLRNIGQLAFDEMEERIHRAIFEMHHLPYPMPQTVKDVDKNMLQVEAPALLGKLNEGWDLGDGPAPEVTLQFWTPKEAYEAYVARYAELLKVTV